MTLTVAVPASSANLGAGFDVLGLALAMPMVVSLDPNNGRPATGGHPARTAFAAAGGRGDVYCDDRIPSGRGLGFSGAARAGAVTLAFAQAESVGACDLQTFIERNRDRIHRVAAELEGHGDNVGASVYGGLIVATADEARKFPVVADVRVVVWVPDHTTSTDKSRAMLPVTIGQADAVVNIASASRLVGALTTGDIDALRGATLDRMHQDLRLASSPTGAQVLTALVEHGAECAWLSGSGPTVAAFVRPERCSSLVERMHGLHGSTGRILDLDIDRAGLRA